MTVKSFKKITNGWEAIKLIDRHGRYVGHAEHQNDWDDAEVQASEVIKREGFPDFYILTI